MKHLVLAISLMLLPAGACAAGEELTVGDEQDRISYSIGYHAGGDFKIEDIEIRPELLARGVVDAMLDAKPLMTAEEIHTTLTKLQKDIAATNERKMKEEAEKNLAAGRAYLAENARKDGVNTLPSGLQYTIITEGNGRVPGADDVVEVHYRGTLINGAEFDSSYRRGQPVQFRVDKVIQGWREALRQMKTGGKWRLFIPPELAYGNKQLGEVAPNSTIIFEVELLAVRTEDKVKTTVRMEYY